MAEGRRIPFETVKPSAKEIKIDEEKRTIRFSLDLQESNEKSCPEFSYADLFRSALTVRANYVQFFSWPFKRLCSTPFVRDSLKETPVNYLGLSQDRL